MKGKLTLAFAAGIAATFALLIAFFTVELPELSATPGPQADWSPTKPAPEMDVYYPGTEAIAGWVSKNISFPMREQVGAIGTFVF